MSSRLTIKIKRRNLSGWCIWILIILPFLFGFLNEMVGVPWGIRYILDVAWLILLGTILTRRYFDAGWQIGVLPLWVCLFLLYTLLVYILNYQSVLYYLWGVRNNFRFYVAFFSFACFLKVDDFNRYLKMFDGLFWLNAVVTAFQFFVMGLEGDHLGGVFSTEAGGNGYTNMFLLIIVTISIVSCFEKKESMGKCFAKCGTALIVAALAELKFFFVEFLMVIFMAVMLNHFSWRKFWILAGCVAGVAVCASLLTKLFPGFAGWFSVQWLLDNAVSTHGYTSSGDLNRLNALPQINAMWLHTSWQRLLGLGLGNCDTSTFSVLNTPFFQNNEDMHYTWISYAMMYLECGLLGLVFYWGFFVLVYINAWRIGKYSQGVIKLYCCIARIIAILCVVISIYNSTLRTEAAYMGYFVMAIPFAYRRETRSASNHLM